MEVTVLQSTENPERLVCQAARGDYYEGYVGDSEYAEIMEPIDYEEQHLDGLPELCYADSPNARRMMQAEINTGNLSNETILEAKTRAFIEEQLTRGHYGPLEHPQITFSVKGVSRVTMAQITRHRHLTFDIQSMRYADFSEQEIVMSCSSGLPTPSNGMPRMARTSSHHRYVAVQSTQPEEQNTTNRRM